MTLQGKNILLGVTGSIAAYKAAVLIRLLVKEEANVQVVMTEGACDFITPLTLSVLSKHPVHINYFDKETGAWDNHVSLGAWPDYFLIAPATANTIAAMANGFCENLLSATYLSAKCPVGIAPAMDLDMYKHPAVQHNIKALIAYGHDLFDAEEGELASGLEGKGRMMEPEAIIKKLAGAL